MAILAIMRGALRRACYQESKDPSIRHPPFHLWPYQKGSTPELAPHLICPDPWPSFLSRWGVYRTHHPRPLHAQTAWHGSDPAFNGSLPSGPLQTMGTPGILSGPG